jgi:hypothetical protein
MAYLAYTDVEAFLNITLTADGRTLVNAIIPAIEAFVDSYCNRTWSKAAGDEIIETFDGGKATFFVKNPPVAEIVSITDDGDAVDADDIYNYGSYIKLAYKASPVPLGVVITYKTSATTPPADLKHALVQWVSQIFKSQSDAGKVTSRISTGPLSIDFLAQDGIPKFVEMVLDRYRLVPM